MLPQFAQRQGSALRVERFSQRSAVIARVCPEADTASRLSDLRHLARRYNAMLDQNHPALRIAR